MILLENGNSCCYIKNEKNYNSYRLPITTLLLPITRNEAWRNSPSDLFIMLNPLHTIFLGIPRLLATLRGRLMSWFFWHGARNKARLFHAWLDYFILFKLGRAACLSAILQKNGFMHFCCMQVSGPNGTLNSGRILLKEQFGTFWKCSV